MAAIGLYINSTEQGFTVRGVNNNFFPDNATLAYPANSVILITDESDMATFRSASNYDVLFSALIKDININGEQVTKDNIIETFNEAANKPSGGGGNPDAFTSVKYDGTKSLIFYNDKGDEVANVDVTPFIKDGMVSNVEILNGNLVITFNTDSGKQPITIPLTDIFNPNNYYDKTTADSTFATQVVVNEEIAARIQGDADINTALQAKADKTDTYTKTQVDDALALKQDASTAFSGDYNDLTNKPTIPTVPTNVSAFTNDAGYLTQHQSLSDYYTKTETDNAIATAMEDIDLSDYVDVTTFNKKELATAKALTQLNQDVSDIDAKEEVIASALTEVRQDVDTLSGDVQTKVATSDFNAYSAATATALGNKQDALVFYSENEYDEETGEEATAMIQVIGQGDYQGDSSGINVQPFIVELGTSSEGEDTTLIIESNGVTINGKRVLTENDLESAKAYYVDFGVLTTQGITDADWDGLVNAINAHRPIYAVLGGEYYVSECLAQSGNQIILTASNHLAHFFYTFTKNDSENYLFDYVTNPYVSQTEKDAWSAKQDALVSGTNIKTVNNQSILGEGNIEIQGGGGGMDEDTELLISSALVDLNDRKIDATEVKENYQKKGDYATNAKVDTKANISDVPTNEDYEEAQKITSWSLNDLNARFGGVRLQIITQSDYEALATKDNNTLYVIRTD